MKFTALIVDDEPLACQRVRTLLQQESDIEVLGECCDAADALAAINRKRPDILFLDIQMPEMDGFQLLAEIGAPYPVVIFVTAYDTHAVRAFEAHALDYLLKPFKPARFRGALDRAREQLVMQQPKDLTWRLLSLLQTHQPAGAHLTRIAVRERQRVRFVKTADIDWIEASGNYVALHCGKEKHLVRETLTVLEQQLAPRDFVRISRSAIVQIDRVQHIEPSIKNEHVVVLADGSRLAMTRGLRDVQERLRFI